MGLEIRSGKTYYYRKIRENGRVVSKYAGSGDLALFAMLMDSDRREEEQGETEAEKAELAELDAEEARITAYLKCGPGGE